MADRPLPEGYGTVDHVARDERYHAARFASTATLADLAREYAIFTHGMFFTHGRLDVDPVLDYVNRHSDPDCVVMPVTYSCRIFGGLSAPGRRTGPGFNWEATLMFVEHRFWDGLRDHLRCCAWVDRRRRSYGRAVLQHIPLVDFLALARAVVLPAPLPTVEITAFGVDGNRIHAQFLSDIALPDSVPTVTYLPVLSGTVALADALLGADSCPFRFIEGDLFTTLRADVRREDE